MKVELQLVIMFMVILLSPVSYSLVSFVTNELPMLNFELKEYDVCVDSLNILESVVFLKITKINSRFIKEFAILFCLHYTKATFF